MLKLSKEMLLLAFVGFDSVLPILFCHYIRWKDPVKLDISPKILGLS
jgi:hypothetical protein